MILEAVFTITAYATGCDTKPNHPTKSGILPALEWTVAADTTVLPIGSIVQIEGLGERMVHDIGGGVKGLHIDLYVENCRIAKDWGRRFRVVKILHRPKGK
jgi:3D (Asp-Asp-Asp) domain-containing protein